ncbi:MAG: GDP-mannose 4,6-dehydratase [Thermomicrobiales bacterium]
MNRRALVTGGAGFIGSHLVEHLLDDGWEVVSIDNFDPFYDPRLKHERVELHEERPGFSFHEVDIRDRDALIDSIPGTFDVIVHLAAKAGVRPSLEDPLAYQDVNVRGTQVLLEEAKRRSVPQFVFASSSSVYGVNRRTPWSEDDYVLEPISPYAATKVSGELLGKVYSHLFGMRFVALRFFTVYGPRQRPDLAISKFSRLIQEGKPITLFGDGSTRRDYTFIDDIIQGVRSAIGYEGSDYEVVNLGNNRTVSLHEMVETIEASLGIEARREYLPEQPGDVPITWADLTKAQRLLDYDPLTDFQTGIRRYASWLQSERVAVAV